MSQTAKYFLAGVALIAALSDSVWAQYDVTSYNGTTGNGDRWQGYGYTIPNPWNGFPANDWWWNGGSGTLKGSIRTINLLTNYNFNNGNTISLLNDLTTNNAGVIDGAFPTINAQRYVRIDGDSARTIEAMSNYNAANSYNQYYNPMFSVSGDLAFTVTGSLTLRHASRRSGSGYGGAVSVLNGGRLWTETDMLFDNNEAANGGAVSLTGASMNAENTPYRPNGNGTLTFLNNHAGSNGGAIWASGSSAIFHGNTLFQGNRANTLSAGPWGNSGTGGGSGGAIWAANSTFIFRSTVDTTPLTGGQLGTYANTFRDGYAGTGGGFINSDASTFQFESDAIFSSGIAYSGAGGAMNLTNNSTLIVLGDTRMVFGSDGVYGSGNSANGNGGAISLTNSRINPDNQGEGIWTFRGNIAGYRGGGGNGGAIGAVDSEVHLGVVVFENNTATGNSGSRGGAIFAERSPFTFHSSAEFISNNGSSGGAIQMVSSDFTFLSTALFDSNTQTGGNGASAGGAIWMSGGNLIFNDRTEFYGNQSMSSGNNAISGGGIHSEANANVVFSNRDKSVSFGGGQFIKDVSSVGVTPIDYAGHNPGNTAGGYGGGVDARDSFHLFNSRVQFENNEAALGGAIFGDRSLFHFDNEAIFGYGAHTFDKATHQVEVFAFGDGSLKIYNGEIDGLLQDVLGYSTTLEEYLDDYEGYTGNVYLRSMWLGSDTQFGVKDSPSGLFGPFERYVVPSVSGGVINRNDFKMSLMAQNTGNWAWVLGAVQNWGYNEPVLDGDGNITGYIYHNYAAEQTVTSDVRLNGYSLYYTTYLNNSEVNYGNVASAGGAITLQYSSMSFASDVEFYGNRATSSITGFGGAIMAARGAKMYFGTGDNVNSGNDHSHIVKSKMNPTSTVFAYNYSHMMGGAIGAHDAYIYGTAVSFTPTELFFNSGLSSSSDKVVAFVNNSAYQIGGAIAAYTSLEQGINSPAVWHAWTDAQKDNYIATQVDARKNEWTKLTFEGETIFEGNFTLGSYRDYSQEPIQRVNNQWLDGGGAIYADRSIFKFDSGTARETRFIENKSATQAGAIFAERQSEITFNGTIRFIDNVANALDTYIDDGNSHGGAGAILATYESVFTFNAPSGVVEFTRNFAAEDPDKMADGGAIVAGNPFYGDDVPESIFYEDRMYIAYNLSQDELKQLFDSNILTDDGTGQKLFDGRPVDFEETYYDNVVDPPVTSIYEKRSLSNGATFTFAQGTPVVFRDNYATRHGGAIIANNSIFTFNGAVGGKTTALDYEQKALVELGFLRNEAGVDGGAIYAEMNSVFTFNNLASFKENTAGHDGGALIVNSGSVITFNHTTEFIGNAAVRLGGAMYIGGTTDYVANSNNPNPNPPADNKNHSTVNLSPGKGYTVKFDGNTDVSGSNAVYMAEDGVLNITPANAAYVKFYDQITGVANSVINIDGTGIVQLYGTNEAGDTTTGDSKYYGITNVSKGRFELKYEDTHSASYGVVADRNSDGVDDGIGFINVTNGAVIALELGTQLGGELITLDGGIIEVSGVAKPAASADTSVIYGNIKLGTNGGTLDVRTGHQLTIEQAITGGGNLTIGLAGSKVSTGTVVLAEQQQYTGETIVNSGTLRLTDNKGETLESSSVLRLLGSSVLDLANTDQVLKSLDGSKDSTIKFGIAANGTNTDNVLTIETNPNNPIATKAYNGTISGTGILKKTGEGKLILGGNNTYSAKDNEYSTQIISGILEINNVASLGSGKVGIFGPATLELNFATSSSTSFFANDVEGFDDGHGYTVGDIMKTGIGRVMVSGNVNLIPNDATNQYAQGNVFITKGTLAVASEAGNDFIAKNIIVGAVRKEDETIESLSNSGTLEIVNKASAHVTNDAQFFNGSTLSITISDPLDSMFDAYGTQVSAPQLVSDDRVLVGENTTLNINIRDVTTLNNGTLRSLVLIHADKGIYKMDTNGLDTASVTGGGENKELFKYLTFGGLAYNAESYTTNSFVVLSTQIKPHYGSEWNGDVSNSGYDYVVSYGLAWYADNELKHGTFNITEQLGEVSVGVLNDSVNLNNVVENAVNGWNGKTLTKEGVGTLVLTAKNNYSGGTIINNGIVKAKYVESIGKGDVSIASGGALQFDLAGSGKVENAISGSGSVIKSGNAKLELKSNNGSGTFTYTGNTIVLGGELYLNGSNRNSSVYVTGNGATFSTVGGGVVDERSRVSSDVVEVGGLYIGGDDNSAGLAYLKPGGDDIGTISVVNNVVFGTDSVFDVQVAADRTFDRVIIGAGAGVANLSGGIINVSAANSSLDFVDNQYLYDGIFVGYFGTTRFKDYNIDGLAGLADYNAELYYSGNSKVSLVLVRKDFTYGGGTHNQNTLARGLDSLILDDDLRNDYRLPLQELRKVSRAEMHAAMNQMAGDIKANALEIGMWDVARPVVDRIKLDPFNLTDMPRYGQTRHNVWADATYSDMSMLGDGNARGYRISRYGVMVGLDRKWSASSMVGVFFGYSNPKLRSDGDEVEANDFQVGVYGGVTTWQQIEVKGYVGVGLQNYNSRRTVDNPLISPTPAQLTAEGYEGNSFIATLEAGKPFTWSWGVVRPVGAIDWSISGVRGHSETGDEYLAGRYEQSTYGRLNVRGGGRIELAQTDLTSLWVQGFIGMKLFGDEAPETKMRFVHAGDKMSPMYVRGSNPGAAYVTFGLGNYWNLNIQKTRQLSIHYDLFMSQRMTNNSVWLSFWQKW
ncbi:MAG: autotransporter-associated beta strand repeat-containing protein [Planctomycetaceae bacterium]|jgi:autotransporter-associated beta strand protein/predicted outer membrane repeat protein|nr:autotransporter-associated beta strand repeat-containing protein [Planctomycetaceae bacterium]